MHKVHELWAIYADKHSSMTVCLIQNAPHLSSRTETNCSFSHVIYFKSQLCISSKTFVKLEINACLRDIHPKV